MGISELYSMVHGFTGLGRSLEHALYITETVLDRIIILL